MADPHRKSWRDLCSAALEAKDPDELLKIVQRIGKLKFCVRDPAQFCIL